MNNAEILNNYAVQVLALAPDLGGGYEAIFPLLARSVVGYGQTRQEAVDDLLESVPAFIEAINETGRNLPATEAPKSWDEFSGKFNVRVPKVLHARLARIADEQGVSLNSIVQSMLMSGATALDAGHEFGAIVEMTAEPVGHVPYSWQAKGRAGATRLRLEYCDKTPPERNDDEWRMVVGN